MLVHGLRGFGDPGDEVAVVIPTTRIDLHEAHAALHGPTGAERFRGKVASTIGFEDGLRLFGDVEGIGGRGLHLEGRLAGLETGFGLLIALDALHVALVQAAHEVEWCALLVERGNR